MIVPVARGLDPPVDLQKASWKRIDCLVKPGPVKRTDTT
ncbi:hypothetical protein ABIB85_003733 [Bradyrhizobium sp. JR1.5]